MHHSTLSTFVFSWMLLVMESNTLPIFDGCWGDMIFIMDASSSIWLVDYRRQLEFVANLVDTFDIGPGPKQVGISAITFSDHAYLDFPLDRYQNRPELKEAILNIPYRMGGTNTAEALKLLRNVLTPYVGRNKRPLMAVVITDGLSWDSTLTKKEAKEVHNLGINMQAIGVGYNYDIEELKSIASDPDQGVHLVTSYSALHGIADKFRTRLCEVIIKEQTSSSSKPSPTIGSKIPMTKTTERMEETNPLESRKETSKSEHVENGSVQPGNDADGVSTTVDPRYTPPIKPMAGKTPKSNAAGIPNRIFTTSKQTSTVASKGSDTDTPRNPISSIHSNSEDHENKLVPPRNIPAGGSMETFTMTPTRIQMAENTPISNTAEIPNRIFTTTKRTSKGSLSDKSRMTVTSIPPKSENRENKSDPPRSIAAGVSTTISSKFTSTPSRIEMAENTPVSNRAEIPNGIFTTEQTVENKHGVKIIPSPSNSENQGHRSVSPRGFEAGVIATIISKFTIIPNPEQITEKTPISNKPELPNTPLTTTKASSPVAPKGSIIDESRMTITSIPPHGEDRKLVPPSNILAVSSTTMSSKNAMESNRRQKSEETPGKSGISSRIFTTTEAASLITGQEASANKPQNTPMGTKSELRETEKVPDKLNGTFTSPEAGTFTTVGANKPQNTPMATKSELRETAKVPDKLNGTFTSPEAGTFTTVGEIVTDKPQTANLPINSKDRQNVPASSVNSPAENVTEFPQKDYASTIVFGFDLKSMGTSRSNSILHFINYILPYIGYGKFALISNALCTQDFNIPLTFASNEDITKHMKISLLRKLNQKKPPVLVDILRQMNEELFKDTYFQSGERPKRKIGVLFVDPSVSEINSEVLVMAEEMKKNGFELFVISLGSYGWTDVKIFSGLSSQPYRDFLFAVPRYESLPQMVKYLPLQFRQLGNK